MSSRSPPIFKKRESQTAKHSSLPHAIQEVDFTTTTTTTTGKTVDSLSGYMEKIAAKMKLENLSVFSSELPDRKKSKTHQESVTITVSPATETSVKPKNESQNIYEFIDMPPLKTGILLMDKICYIVKILNLLKHSFMYSLVKLLPGIYVSSDSLFHTD